MTKAERVAGVTAEHAKNCSHKLTIDEDDDGDGFGYGCDVCGTSGYSFEDEEDDDG